MKLIKITILPALVEFGYVMFGLLVIDQEIFLFLLFFIAPKIRQKSENFLLYMIKKTSRLLLFLKYMLFGV